MLRKTLIIQESSVNLRYKQPKLDSNEIYGGPWVSRHEQKLHGTNKYFMALTIYVTAQTKNLKAQTKSLMAQTKTSRHKQKVISQRKCIFRQAVTQPLEIWRNL